MPELPEIEVIKRDLEKEVVGRRFKEVEVRPGSNAMKIIKRHGRRKEFQDLLVGTKVDSVDRLGTRIIFELDNAKRMIVDLGNTGRLLKTSASDDVAPHTHIVMGFTIGGQLRVVDPKLSGEVFVTDVDAASSDGAAPASSIDPLGPQPLTWHEFSARLEDRSEPMKKLLMDERFIVGLGDIYSDEILFAAGIRYDRLSDKLSSQDVRRLYRALVEVLQDAVRARGTSYGDDSFVDLQGVPGQFQLELKVYERDGEPCRRCRSEVAKEEFESRLTYLCPQCQS